MAIIALSTSHRDVSTAGKRRRPAEGAAVTNVFSFAQSKVQREMPTYLRGGRI